jgi:HAMP domain-containing protein
MTALIASNTVRVTGFERMLLITAAAMDRFVAVRLERRTSPNEPSTARTAATDIRSNALAMGSLGMLPR